MGEVERYSLAGEANVERGLAERTAGNSAGFFVEHLWAGAKVLDCGCGPGTITLGLAEAVHPGDVIGIDIQQDQVARATSLAEQKGVANVEFRAGDVYELPFVDASFDAVFANALLIHLREPGRAIVEMRRVLKPGGLIGIRDADRAFDLRLPETAGLREMSELWIRVLQHNGASPYYARHQRELLVDAGFEPTLAGATPITHGSREATRRHARGTRNVFVSLMRTAIEQGWVDQARVEQLANEIVAWGEKPDAFGQTLWFWSVGWK